MASLLVANSYGKPAPLGAYLLLVRLLRYRTLHLIQEIYAVFAQDPYSMPHQAAHDKLHMLDEQLFLHVFATSWALITTYSGTKPLVQIRQLSTPEKVGRRTEDTTVLLFEGVRYLHS
jgi:hypothetical protein